MLNSHFRVSRASMPLRRRVLCWLVTLPFGGSLATQLKATRDPGSGPKAIPTPAPSTVGLGFVRLVNTLEVGYSRRYNRFGMLRDLAECGLLAEAFESVRSRHKGTWMDLYPQVDVGGGEALPGWSLKLYLSLERDRYLLTMRPTPDTGNDCFCTDQRGVIYTGHPAVTVAWPDAFMPASELAAVGFRPLQPVLNGKQTRWSPVRSLIRQVSLFSVAAEQSPQTCCGCCAYDNYHCLSQPQYGCCNTGFLNCPWCCQCASTCSNCNLVCVYCCGASCYGC